MTVAVLLAGRGDTACQLGLYYGSDPKPALCIAGKPLLFYQLHALNAHIPNLRQILILTHNKSRMEQIMAVAAIDKLKSPITVLEVGESVAEVIKAIVPFENDVYAIVYGGSMCIAPWKSLFDFMKEAPGVGAIIPYVPNSSPNDISFVGVSLDKYDSVVSLKTEKDGWSFKLGCLGKHDEISTAAKGRNLGVLLIRRNLLHDVSQKPRIDVESIPGLINLYLEESPENTVYMYRYTPENAFLSTVAQNFALFAPWKEAICRMASGFKLWLNWLDSNLVADNGLTIVEKETYIKGGVCERGDKVTFKKSYIGERCKFGTKTVINNSIIGNNVVIGMNCNINGSIVGNGCIIADASSVSKLGRSNLSSCLSARSSRVYT